MAKKASANKCVAFLRGINVGGNRKIEMGDLKKFFEKLKYQNVSTIIVYNVSNVEKVIQGYPFDSNEADSQHYVVFLSSNIGDELATSVPFDKKLEEVAVGDGVVYWKVLKGNTLKSKFGILIAKAKYKEHNTVRNINTLRKIVR